MKKSRPKPGKRPFTSVAALLLKAGHPGHVLQLERAVGTTFNKKPHVWFPGLQIVVGVDTNRTTQLQNDNGIWIYRKGRKNGWYQITNQHGGLEFIKLIEPHYVKYLNELMTGEPDAT